MKKIIATKQTESLKNLNTQLFNQVCEDHTDLHSIKRLLNLGASANTKDEEMRTVLMVASLIKDNSTIKKRKWLKCSKNIPPCLNFIGSREAHTHPHRRSSHPK